MTALGPHWLSAACRTIYVRAADDFILPPLLQDAAEPERPHRRIEASIGDISILFRVFYESAGAAPGPLAHSPLRFEIEAGTGSRTVDLTDRDRLEMIRAFLLGVRQPVAVEAPPDSSDFRIGLRLNARIALWSPRTTPLNAGLSTTAVCEQLAARLLDGTRSLFGSQAEGLEVWEVRLREELFGEAPLSAEDIWPSPSPSPVTAPAAIAPVRYTLLRPPHVGDPYLPRQLPERRISRRRALAAAMALVGLAALAGAIASHEPGTAARATTADRLSERSHGPADPPNGRVVDTPPAAFRVASLVEHDALSPQPSDPRFAILAPTVLQAARALGPYHPAPAVAHASGHPTTLAEIERPTLAAPHPAPPRRPALHVKRASQRHAKASPLVRVDRAVKKFVRSVTARLPHARFSALSSPHASGPRQP